MSLEQIPQFLTLVFFKKMIKSSDNQDDDSYLQFVNDANKKVHHDIFPYVGVISPGSKYWSTCRHISLLYARSLHAEDIELIEKSSSYLKKYKTEMFGNGEEHGLIQKMKADRTDRTKSTMITYDPRDNKIPLPTQNDIYTFDDFA